jgi:hypothetical protein
MRLSKLIHVKEINLRCMSCFILISLVLLFLGCTHLEDDKSQSAKYIYLKSFPNTKIFIDGIFIGTTPVNKVKVDPGSRIELRAKGYKTSSITIGKVSPTSLQVTRAIGQKSLTISGYGIKVTMKEEE